MALRSILRQAPNVVMIGEIRDLETATIAINASLTGHLVFSTLHTNDAPSAVTRLMDIAAARGQLNLGYFVGIRAGAPLSLTESR